MAMRRTTPPGTRICGDGRRRSSTTPTGPSLRILGATGRMSPGSRSGMAGAPTATPRRFDQLVRDPDPDSEGLDYLVIVFSAGNSGSRASTITGPKENKNTIVVGNSLTFRPAIGATDDIRGVATSSSRGPARDGRLLPMVVAPGTDVAAALSNF